MGKTIAIGTLMYKRYPVFHCWARGIKRLIEDFPKYNFVIVVVGSEGGTSQLICQQYGFEYIDHENIIGKKANIRLKHMKRFNPDHYIFCGSDDIISSKTFAHAIEKAQEYDHVSSMNLHYYDTISKKFIKSPGYEHTKRKGEPMAPWRILSKSLVSKLDKPWDEKHRNIDSGFYKSIKSLPHSFYFYDDGMILDIKGNNNITPFFVIERKKGVNLLDRNDLYKHFPSVEASNILKLK